jgi:hypothetical protein
VLVVVPEQAPPASHPTGRDDALTSGGLIGLKFDIEVEPQPERKNPSRIVIIPAPIIFLEIAENL